MYYCHFTELFLLTYLFCGAIVKQERRENVKERVKELRKELGLTLEKFGEKRSEERRVGKECL